MEIVIWKNGKGGFDILKFVDGEPWVFKPRRMAVSPYKDLPLCPTLLELVEKGAIGAEHAVRLPYQEALAWGLIY